MSHREQRRAALRHNRQRIVRALAKLMGCSQCNSKENLEWDHIDPATKKFDVMSGMQSSWETILNEIDKCQVLCRKCHDKKSYRHSHKLNIDKDGWAIPPRKPR